MKYKYEGFTKDGKEVSGQVECKSLESAAEHVRINLKVFARKIEPAEEQPVLGAVMQPGDGPAPVRQRKEEVDTGRKPMSDEMDWKEVLKLRLKIVDAMVDELGTRVNPDLVAALVQRAALSVFEDTIS